MSEPGGDPPPSLGDVLRLPKWHPACRRREAQSGSCTERENLAGDAKRKGTASTVRTIFRRYAELGSVALLKAELEWAGMVSKRRERESFPAASASLAVR